MTRLREQRQPGQGRGDGAANTAAELEGLAELSDTVVQVGYLQFDTATGTIVACDRNASDALTIPETINGVPVTAIGNRAFQYCAGLTLVKIPSGVTAIGEMAFLSCYNLTSVEIPSGVTTIGKRAFMWCRRIESFTVDAANPAYTSDACGALFNKNMTELIQYPAANAAKTYAIPTTVTTIGDYAFSGCNTLTEIEIPSNVTKMGFGVFDLCSGIKHFTVDAGNPSYASDARGVLFNKNMTELIRYPAANWEETYAIPNAVTTIGDYAFEVCDNLTSVEIPSSVEEIGFGAFSSCRRLERFTVDAGNSYYSSDANGVLFNQDKTTLIQYPAANGEETYEIPNGVVTIGDDAFVDCDGLAEIKMPSSVTTLGYNAFAGCGYLAVVEFSNSVTTIGSHAFSGCKALTEITIPDGVTEIAEGTFNVCESLSVINLPIGLTTIGKYVFEQCYNLPEIEIPSSVTAIRIGAFSGCEGLTEIEIPSSVTMIEEDAFSYCYGLECFTVDAENPAYASDARGVLFNKNMTELIQYPAANAAETYAVPSSVVTIGEYAFEECCNLMEIEIPNGVTTIGYGAFSHCEGLLAIEIPSSVTMIGEWAFARCYGMMCFTVDAANPAYASDARGVLFNKNMTELIQYPVANEASTYTIPSSVTKIGTSAFYRCYSLIEINLPSGVTEIMPSTFEYCEYLATINLPSKLTAIGSRAFYYCQNLRKIEIPNSVTTIGDSAFGHCQQLRTIKIPSAVTTIAKFTFYGCGKLSTLIIPSSVTAMGNSAFGLCPCPANVYYGGSEEQWNVISFGNNYYGYFADATVHFELPESRSANVSIASIAADTVSGSAVVRVSVESHADIAIPGILMVALYSGDGELKDVANTAENLPALGSVERDVPLDCAISDGDTVKAFYWGDAMRPHAQAYTYLVPSV